MTGIHPTAFVGPDVALGVDVVVGPFAVLLGPARIEDRVWIGPGAKIGAPPEMSSLPQRAAWDGETDYFGVVLGKDVVVRENVVIHQGSHRATTVGRGSWLLNSSYIAHDAVLGEDVTVSAGVQIGGHAEIGSMANLGMGVTIHQRRIVGPGCMIGMGTPVTRDVPPFVKAFGNPIRRHGINHYALVRAGATDADIARLEQAYSNDDDVPATTWDGIGAHVEWWRGHAELRPARRADGES